MQKSKLIDTIKCLTPPEISRLEQFLLSPYFHAVDQNTSVLALLRYIVQFHPGCDHPDLDREITYKYVFPDSPLAKSRLEKTMSRLLQETQRFIVLEVEQARRQDGDEQMMLIHFLKERNNVEEYERLFHKIHAKISGQLTKDAEHFFRLYKLEDEYSSFLAWTKGPKLDLNLQSGISSLHTYYLLIHLEYAVQYLSQTKIVPLKQDISFLDPAFLELLFEKLDGAPPPIVQVYFKAYQLLSTHPSSPAIFLEFNALLDKYEHFLPEEKVKNFQALVRNHCIREFNEGNESFFQIAFDMYKLHLENGYLYRGGLIHAMVVKNLVSMGLRMNRQEWVVQFLEAHKDRIMGIASPEDAYLFNLAVCSFHVRDFDAVLDLLRHQYDDVFYKTAAKRLEIKVLHEIESPILDARIEAFNILVFRMGGKQLSDVYINGNKYFVSFLRRILNPATRHDERRIQKLKTALQQAPTVVEKDWLMDVLERLGKSS